jgi:hypothetical protein
MYNQIVTPNLNVTDGAGWCLRFTQSVWGAPVRYNSAWDAWNATQHKHGTGEALPEDASTVVWFSHYGRYGTPPTYANWGHVVTWVPGRGFLSSPGSGYGQQWFNSTTEVENYFNAGYVGWSEDLNGLRLIEPGATPTPKGKKKTLATCYYTKDNNGNLWALGGDGDNQAAWIDTRDQETATGWARAHNLNEVAVTLSVDEWARIRNIYLGK